MSLSPDLTPTQHAIVESVVEGFIERIQHLRRDPITSREFEAARRMAEITCERFGLDVGLIEQEARSLYRDGRRARSDD